MKSDYTKHVPALDILYTLGGHCMRVPAYRSKKGYVRWPVHGGELATEKEARDYVQRIGGVLVSEPKENEDERNNS